MQYCSVNKCKYGNDAKLKYYKTSLFFRDRVGIYKTNNGKNRELTEFELDLYKLCSTTL